MLRKLLPSNLKELESSNNIAGIPVAMIQVNVLNCGGIAIGTQTSHKIIDGPTSTTFLKAWAISARGTGEIPRPSFIAPQLFPQNSLLPRDTMLAIWPSLLKFGKCVTKRFVFDSSAISTLKDKASSSSFVPNPTRVESVSAFIWICVTVASRKRYGSRRPSVLSHIVNFRGKKASSLPEHSIGNLLWIATAECQAEANLELQSLVALLRKSIMKTSGKFVEQLQGEKGYQKVRECLTELAEVHSNGGADYFAFSSMCKVGIYEADFGWGKPLWVSPGGIDGLVYQNLVFLNETRNGDGIEVWVTLDEQDMTILQYETEILSFASLDPSPFEEPQD
ncbi:Transferase [Corchorus capsularis]|uniref:Transferase n=1 Tax=Corchorus capsularis TaxID=210143 RepID=A0A1R3K7L3_COCAP|nr:Transferase [Corchorus capsularis]